MHGEPAQVFQQQFQLGDTGVITPRRVLVGGSGQASAVPALAGGIGTLLHQRRFITGSYCYCCCLASTFSSRQTA